MKRSRISRPVWIALMLLACLSTKSQVLERLDLGITVKNDFISPVVSYQLRENAALEFTLPFNYKLTPGRWVDAPGLHSFYGAIKYVNPWTIGAQTLDIYPMLIALNSNAYGPNGLSDPLALGLGIGKSFRSRGWTIRPELELSFVREWFLPSAGAPIEHYYTSWPSIGITLKH
jgi:hypothetical protein